MKIRVDQVAPIVTQRYPYTHRVEVSGDTRAADKVVAWLEQTGFGYTTTSWGVYYLGPKATAALLLRWS